MPRIFSTGFVWSYGVVVSNGLGLEGVPSMLQSTYRCLRSDELLRTYELTNNFKKAFRS